LASLGQVEGGYNEKGPVLSAPGLADAVGMYLRSKVFPYPFTSKGSGV
jgi:hypothetical protein